MAAACTRSDRARAWVRFANAHRGGLLAAFSLLALLGAAGTVRLYSDLRPDISELLPRHTRSVRDLDQVSARVGGWAEDAVVLTGADKPSLERFADALDQRLSKEPPTLIRWVEYRVDDLGDFFGARRWLFPSLSDLQLLRRRLAARLTWEKERANPLFVPLDGSTEPPPIEDVIRRITRTGNHGLLHRFPDGYFVGEAPGPGQQKILALVMLVRIAGTPDDEGLVERVDRAVRAQVRATREALLASPGGARYRGIQVAYGGDVASAILEHDALAHDLLVATLLVMLAVALAIALYYRTWKAIPGIGIPLLVGVLITFGLADLAVGHLNSNTAFLGSIVVGNGINVGLILFARYLEERRKGQVALAAMEIAVEQTWLATLTAALAAGVSYASLMATRFRGFNQFGFIGGIGMALCWIMAYAMIPPLCLAWEARRPMVRFGQRPARPIFTEAVARAVERFPRAILLGTAAAALASGVALVRFARHPIEMDISKLRDRRALLPGEPGWWDERVDAIFGDHLTPTVFMCKDQAEARAVAAAIVAEQKSNPHTAIGTVTSIASFVPGHQAEKLPVIAGIRALATDSALKLLPAGERKRVVAAEPPAGLRAFTAAELPLSLRRQITETDGRIGTMVLVYPTYALDVWNGRDVLRFARELRGIKLPRPGIPVAGSILVFADVLHTIGEDGPRATWLSFAGVVLLVLLAFGAGRRGRRSLGNAACVLGALTLGVLWFGGLAGAFDLKLNMLNFIAIPITFGIGVDYATNIFQRRRLDVHASIADCLRTTGGAVALCSLTTVLGYSSLLVARNQALSSFGLLADMGEAACLAAALLALPAFLRWREARGRLGAQISDSKPNGTAVG